MNKKTKLLRFKNWTARFKAIKSKYISSKMKRQCERSVYKPLNENKSVKNLAAR